MPERENLAAGSPLTPEQLDAIENHLPLPDGFEVLCVECPTCARPAGEPCVMPGSLNHIGRREAARRFSSDELLRLVSELRASRLECERARAAVVTISNTARQMHPDACASGGCPLCAILAIARVFLEETQNGA